MFQLADQTLEHQTIKTGKDQVYYLGHNLHLKHCTLELRTAARDLVIAYTTLEDCLVHAAQRLVNFRWDHVWLRRCRFRGHFRGNDFGRWSEDDPAVGGIADCDFSEALLDGCRFINCDARTIRFPRWPCFTILDPDRRAPELAMRPWPGKTRLILRFGDYAVLETAATTYSAPHLTKQWGSSLEELRAFLETLDGVIL